ncbi:MAG: 5-methyltetrahydropteroyltriglutamate--homocysteine S-methyltransferase [Gammaproteobacteria bacterium]|nr:5-methyltetrahydropteroyltriglutamate--homocysteine S-methyltransferase [Gammaproteobacteria bacterium]
MSIVHNLGFPRIGQQRELKWALESYWRGEIDQAALLQQGENLRQQHWAQQAQAGVELLPVGDFSWYDHVLDTSVMLGVIPPRFAQDDQAPVDLDTYFRMARGRAPQGTDSRACEMTKWFDTNYHYIVPEFAPDQEFRIADSRLFDQTREAQTLGYAIKPVLLGPLSYLWLGKCSTTAFEKLELVDRLIPIYSEILHRLKQQGVQWVQIDEPILVLDLPLAWQRAFATVYTRLSNVGARILLASYFGELGDNLHLAVHLPVDGLHIDLARAPQQLRTVADQLPIYKVLSAGIIDGRNVWTGDLHSLLQQLKPLQERFGERLWLAPSCSLLHCPVNRDNETALDPELLSWLAFAVQKLAELNLLKQALDQGEASVAPALAHNQRVITARRTAARIHHPSVQTRLNTITEAMATRHSGYTQRAALQQQLLGLPLLPTTTIGSFPQTDEVRHARSQFRQQRISQQDYEAVIKQHIQHSVMKQHDFGLDVLVHGEAERTDMVEYFGEQLAGFAFTSNGWVQSYGSRCVKPPILYGDVSRPKPMTVEWSRYAQSLTTKPMKGMLTGPVTILQWSFVRDDQPRQTTCQQIALALRDEVRDLEAAGIKIIQIDEPALREGLPLRRSAWQDYLRWATQCFRLSAATVEDKTQIHTHMCYAEFNDIIEWIAALDADVITIETSRSHMELLNAFKAFAYPNAIGPGTYDIHSPRQPTQSEIKTLLEKATAYIPVQRLWVNPDCGLKTRRWEEVDSALRNMVAAAKEMRANLTQHASG